jgi:hypothetical protein
LLDVGLWTFSPSAELEASSDSLASAAAFLPISSFFWLFFFRFFCCLGTYGQERRSQRKMLLGLRRIWYQGKACMEIIRNRGNEWAFGKAAVEFGRFVTGLLSVEIPK